MAAMNKGKGKGKSMMVLGPTGMMLTSDAKLIDHRLSSDVPVPLVLERRWRGHLRALISS